MAVRHIIARDVDTEMLLGSFGLRAVVMPLGQQT